VLTSIISTLLAIDEMLPPQERLSPETSASRNHFPKLHTLLVGKAAELNICFGSGRRPATTANTIPANTTYPTLRRRLSSSSQILLSGGGGGGGVRAIPAPHLHLKTLLPTGSDVPPASKYSTSSSGSGEGAYFPIAPQTATGVSLTHSNGKSSTTTTHNSLLVKPATMEPRRSSGNWSVLFGAVRREGASAESAEERLRCVLEGGKGKGKGKGKGVVGLGTGW